MKTFKSLSLSECILTFALEREVLMLVLYIIISLTNVFLHIVRSILVIKSGKFIASLANCVCYTFSAVVIKFIAETDLWTAIAVQAATNFLGCYMAMLFCEKIIKRK